METKTNVKLLPCPCCGDTDVRIMRTLDVDAICWHVECLNCGMRTSSYGENCDYKDTHENVTKAVDDAIECAVETWNNRAYCGKADDGKSYCAKDTDYSNLGNDELAHVIKRGTDALVDRAKYILDEIAKVLEEKK